MTTKEITKELINEYAQACYPNNQSMYDYIVKSTLTVKKFSNGLLCDFDKPSIKTRFCYGYDDYGKNDMDNASNNCRLIKQSQNFINENLKQYVDELEYIKNARLEEIIIFKNKSNNDNIGAYETLKYYNPNRIDYLLNTLNGMYATEYDRNMIIEGIQAQIDNLTKRLNTYLKKYGTDKLVTWTYWRD